LTKTGVDAARADLGMARAGIKIAVNKKMVNNLLLIFDLPFLFKDKSPRIEALLKEV
jgi:hypothetical protein